MTTGFQFSDAQRMAISGAFEAAHGGTPIHPTVLTSIEAQVTLRIEEVANEEAVREALEAAELDTLIHWAPAIFAMEPEAKPTGTVYRIGVAPARFTFDGTMVGSPDAAKPYGKAIKVSVPDGGDTLPTAEDLWPTVQEVILAVAATCSQRNGEEGTARAEASTFLELIHNIGHRAVEVIDAFRADAGIEMVEPSEELDEEETDVNGRREEGDAPDDGVSDPEAGDGQGGDPGEG